MHLSAVAKHFFLLILRRRVYVCLVTPPLIIQQRLERPWEQPCQWCDLSAVDKLVLRNFTLASLDG